MKSIYRLVVILAVVLVVIGAAWALVSAASLTGDGASGRQPIGNYKGLIPRADMPRLRPSGDRPAPASGQDSGS